MPKKKAEAAEVSLEELAKKYFRAKEAGKRGYSRADRLLNEIATKIQPGEEIALGESGRKLLLTDRFKDKTIVWNPCAARRWELEIIEP